MPGILLTLVTSVAVLSIGQGVAAQTKDVEQKTYSLKEANELLVGKWAIDRVATRTRAEESELPDVAIPEIEFEMWADGSMVGTEGGRPPGSGTYSLEETDEPNEFYMETEVGNDTQLLTLRIISKDQVLIIPDKNDLELVFKRQKKKKK